ncbi:FmdB family zinc ribbon protein [Rhabdochromatium marinum]|uniref:FmdB family zinc ribbon protein n=1 Tax=Rhabdochromatium marinum TaxID=48729 RepID=UPI00190633F8|nr:zinc ribbon domain-containing protein [Rhabdochromatium marinum]MBK1647352.1 FmdB family transcriptional regulator [Rhabdochromatium marinum]
MPIYEYQCTACGHEMDALQKISDAPLTDCTECGASALKKKISAAAFRLKGSGWYETDFKQDRRKNVHESGDKSGDSSASGEKSSGGDGKAAAKSDTKPAAKESSTSPAKPKSGHKAA